MDCGGAMFALQACPVAMASGRLHGFASTSKLPNGRRRLRQLTQVRANCHSQQNRALNGLERTRGYGATALISGYNKRVGCVASEDLSVGAFHLEEEEGDAWLVDEVATPFNQISVLELDDAADHELAGAYVLKLDGANLAHSVYWRNGQVWSGGCHDVFASLPPLLPEGGPVAILGLGAGTVARLLLHIWPSLHLEGWELDSEVVRVARQYFALTDLESPPARKASPSANRKTKKKKAKRREEEPRAFGGARWRCTRCRGDSEGRLCRDHGGHFHQRHGLQGARSSEHMACTEAEVATRGSNHGELHSQQQPFAGRSE